MRVGATDRPAWATPNLFPALKTLHPSLPCIYRAALLLRFNLRRLLSSSWKRGRWRCRSHGRSHVGLLAVCSWVVGKPWKGVMAGEDRREWRGRPYHLGF
ncbi:unnamed protein product [Musa textilis]